MLEWLDVAAGPGYAQAVLWTLLALLLLLVLLVVVKVFRTMTFGTFVSGGKNRKTRLAVMDATAVDSHRRLILVRRDDTEHLLLVGGPTDVVVERDIHLGQVRRPSLTIEPRETPPPPSPPQAPAPTQPAPRLRPVEPTRPAPRPAAERTPTVVVPKPAETPQKPAARQEPQVVVQAQKRPTPPPPASTPAPVAKPQASPPQDDLDDALMKELESSLDDAAKPGTKAAPSLDDEMAKLLGELANPRRN